MKNAGTDPAFLNYLCGEMLKWIDRVSDDAHCQDKKRKHKR